MGIETEMAALTAALNRNSDLLEILTSKAKPAIESKAAEKAAAPVEKASEKTAPVEDAPKPRATRGAAKLKAEKTPAEKDMADATVKFLEVDGDEEYEARRGLVKKIVAKFGVKKMSEIAEGERKGALDMLEAYKAGDDPFAEAEEDDLA